MKTSYFSKSKKHPNAVSIAWRAPVGFKGREYKALAPKYWLLKKYKEDGDKDFYTAVYKEDILRRLNPEQVYKDLGEDAVLLCWENPDDFCHRHIVAKWLQEAGYDIEELTTKKLRGEPKLIAMFDDLWE